MKKRFSSLLLCFIMIFSLLPNFVLAADEITIGDEIYVEANAEGQTTWTIAQIQAWTANHPDNAVVEDGSTGLYIKPDLNANYVFPVQIEKDSWQVDKRPYTGTVNEGDRNIYKVVSQDSKHNTSKTPGYSSYGNTLRESGTGTAAGPMYCLDSYGNPHQLYYNVWYEKYESNYAYYLVQVFYYTNDAYYTTHRVTSSDNYLSALQNGYIEQINARGKDAETTTVIWPFGFRVRNNNIWNNNAYGGTDVTEYSSGITAIYPIPYYRNLRNSSNASGYKDKLAMLYMDESLTVYMAREVVNATNTRSWSGKLYYKKDASVQELPEEAYPLDIPAAGSDQFTTESGATISNPGEAVESDLESGNAGLRLSKLLNENSAGNYDLTLESYASADATKQTVTQKDPTDFIVVVDQSGSMKENDMAVNYTKVSGNVTLENIANGQYYTRGNDGRMYRVFAVQNYLYQYFAPNTKWVKNVIDESQSGLSWFQGNQEQGFTVRNQYYYRDSTNNKVVYRPITVSVAGQLLMYSIQFHYTDASGVDQYFHYPENPYYYPVFQSDLLDIHNPYTEGQTLYGTANSAVKAFAATNQSLFNTGQQADTCYTYAGVDLGIAEIKAGMYINYPMYKRHVGYTKLCYRDINGEIHTIPTTDATGNKLSAEYCDGAGNALTSRDGNTRMLYTGLYTPNEVNGTTTRLSSLKEALNAFATKLANEKNGDGTYVDNRVAIVGFAEENNSSNNTEILTNTAWTDKSQYGTTQSHNQSYLFPDGVNYNGIGYSNSITPDDYRASLVPAGEGTVDNHVTAAIDAITANGGTQPETGLDMALKILQNREDKSRNSVVIMFTDGKPGDYAYSDQYSEANQVVAKAKEIKDNPSGNMNTMLFTIGVFSESDINPLTYYPPDGNHRLSRANSDLEYEDGWIKTLTPSETDGYYYYLKRQWRPNNDEFYGADATDTIYDYMSVTSSNYRNATGYIDSNWLAGNAPTSWKYLDAIQLRGEPGSDINQYYRMASNQQTLIDAFTQMVTRSVDMYSSDSSVTLDSSAALKDQINTTNFDVSNATYSVSYVPIKATKVEGTEDTYNVAEDSTRETIEILANQPVPANGLVSYSGYSWVDYHIYVGHLEGYKLVMKITGLEPKIYNTDINSNEEAGVYSGNEPVLTIESPKLNVPKTGYTYFADFNAKLILATDVPENGIKDSTENNGQFTRTNDSKAVYQLNSGKQKPASVGSEHSAVINTAYSSVDFARINGTHVEDNATGYMDVTVIPASSVYYDDELAGKELTVGDGSGKNDGINGSDITASKSATRMDTDTSAVQYYYTFYGKAIDIYCTTHSAAGSVQAAVYKADSKKDCVKANMQGSIKTMRNYSSENYYNVPSLHFDLETADTYTVRVYAMKGAKYQLDGIRVYGATDKDILKNTKEADAHYLNMRGLMLNDISAGKFDVEKPAIETISGVLYVDNASNLVTKTATADGGTADIYTTVFDAYVANSPKNEIYLDQDEAITFQLDTDKTETAHVYIGLSAPKTGSGTVKINGVETAVNSYVDMYYPIRVPSNGTVIIYNDGGEGNIISLTDLKITGVEQLTDPQAAKALFAPVTLRTVRFAANNGFGSEEIITEEPSPEPTIEPGDDPTVEPEPEQPIPEPTAEPTSEPTVTPTQPNSITNIVKQVVSGFVQSLIRNISRLFGR